MELQPIGASLGELGFHNPPLEKQALCDIHGEYISKCYRKDAWQPCQLCEQERREKEAAARLAKEAQEKQRRIEARVGQSGIPDRFQSCALKDYLVENEEQRKIVEFATSYADEFATDHSGRCAIFMGKPGTGKTHIACAIGLRAMHRYGRTVMFTTVSKMARKVRECKSFGSDMSESEAIRLFTTPDLLILDEVGLQSGTDAEARTIFDILNDRHEAYMPTIFLTNLDEQGMRLALGERLFDRLREDGCARWVFDWASHRGRKAA